MSTISLSSRLLGALVTGVVALALWAGITNSGLVSPLFIPGVSDTFNRLRVELASSDVYINLAYTSFRALVGLGLAVCIGVPLGLLLGRSKTLFRLLELPVEFLRSIPPSALFPLFILIFGLGNASKIAVAFYACALILIVNSYYGVMPTPDKQLRIDTLRIFGATKSQIFLIAVLRDALPNVAAGFRVCLSYSFALVVVTEMLLGANSGLGRMIYDYYLAYRIPEMYAVIILLGAVGFTINQLYLLLEKKYLFWSSS